jgi:hypothetical protein
VGPSYNVGEGPSSSNVEEGQSGIRYRDNAVQLDLNTQWKDPYEFEDEPSQPAYGYTYDANRGDDTSEEQDYTHYEDSAVDEKRVEDQEEGPNPINLWFETNRTFSTRDELVDWVHDTGMANGDVIVIKRSKKRGEHFVKVYISVTVVFKLLTNAYFLNCYLKSNNKLNL